MKLLETKRIKNEMQKKVKKKFRIDKFGPIINETAMQIVEKM
jgi:hypothetical protein